MPQFSALQTHKRFLSPGFVFAGTSSSRSVAIKVEACDADPPQLEYEAHVYRQLTGGVGIPNVHWFGEEDGFNILVLDLLGPSLEHLFISCRRRFSIKTVLLLADQLVDCPWLTCLALSVHLRVVP